MEWILIVVGLAAVLAIVWYVLNGRVEGDEHAADAHRGDAHAVPVAPVGEPAAPADSPVRDDALVRDQAPVRDEAPVHAGAHVAPSPAVDAPAAEVVRDRDAYEDVVVRESDDADDLIDLPDESDRAARIDEADHVARIDEAAGQLAGAATVQDAPAGRRFEDVPAAEPIPEPERVADPERVVEPVRVVEPEPTPQRVVEAPAEVRPAPVVESEPARRLAEPTDADIEQVWDGPFGPGSAEAGPNGEGPRGWTIKGARQTKVYLTPDIPVFNSAKANVWFVDEQRAIDAGFHRWDAPQG